MYTDVTFYIFERAFHDMDRTDNFSYNGRRALYDYFIDLEDSCDMRIELDVIGICCEYTEYDSIKELCDAYDLYFTYDEDEDQDTIAENFKECLYDNDFNVICCEWDCIIIQDK